MNKFRIKESGEEFDRKETAINHADSLAATYPAQVFHVQDEDDNVVFATRRIRPMNSYTFISTKSIRPVQPSLALSIAITIPAESEEKARDQLGKLINESREKMIFECQNLNSETFSLFEEVGNEEEEKKGSCIITDDMSDEVKEDCTLHDHEPA